MNVDDIVWWNDRVDAARDRERAAFGDYAAAIKDGVSVVVWKPLADEWKAAEAEMAAAIKELANENGRRIQLIENEAAAKSLAGFSFYDHVPVPSRRCWP